MDAKSDQPVSNEFLEHGRKLRNARIAVGKTICDVADSAFIDLVLASKIERGLIHNLHITVDEWAK